MFHHLDDLEADFRAVYRLTPAEALELDGPQFLALAYRLTAYPGVLQVRVQEEAEHEAPRQDGELESSPHNLQHNADLADVIDYG